MHEFGNPANKSIINKIASKYELKIIEDAACAFGSKDVENGKYVGATGNTSCFSFHPRKILTTGEGGCIIARDKSIYERVISIRNHGISGIGSNRFHYPGYNSRLTDIQAAIGVEQLSKINKELDARKVIAKKYQLF